MEGTLVPRSMSSALRQRQTHLEATDGKAKRVSDFVKSEFPVPNGLGSGAMLLKEDRKLAAIVLSAIQAVWFVTVAVGICRYAGEQLHQPSALL